MNHGPILWGVFPDTELLETFMASCLVQSDAFSHVQRAPVCFLQLTLLHRCIWSFRRQASALAHLPGPQIQHPLGLTEMLTGKEPHRLLLDMAERYGPIYKIRVLHLHVRPLRGLTLERPSLR